MPAQNAEGFNDKQPSKVYAPPRWAVFCMLVCNILLLGSLVFQYVLLAAWGPEVAGVRTTPAKQALGERFDSLFDSPCLLFIFLPLLMVFLTAITAKKREAGEKALAKRYWVGALAYVIGALGLLAMAVLHPFSIVFIFFDSARLIPQHIIQILLALPPFLVLCVATAKGRKNLGMLAGWTALIILMAGEAYTFMLMLMMLE